MKTAIDGLREATSEIHARLHHHPAFAPLMRNPPDAAGYAGLLRQLHGFHAPAETQLLAAAAILVPALDDLAQRRKAHLLLADRDLLEGLFPTGALDADERLELGPAATAAEVLGGLYVTEGATLGGRELGRHLGPALASLGLEGNQGRQFFMAYGPRQGEMWRRFCAVLEASAAGFSESERQQMDAAARRTFLAMEDWLTRSLVPA